MNAQEKRYQARPTGITDGLGLPNFAVIDTAHNDAEIHVWSGYFAGQDAREQARELNGEGEDHE